MEISNREYEKLKQDASFNRFVQRIGICVFIAILLLICLGMWGCPNYAVWSSEMNGKAQLSEAEYSKQVQIQEAQSNLEAEKLNAEAEVERAKGAAEARNAEGLGMTPEQYIQYLWVKKLSLADASIIYLPTDGGIPVLTQDVTNAAIVEENEES